MPSAAAPPPPPPSVSELVELPARVAELAALLQEERAARQELEANFRLADQSALDAKVADRLEVEAMKLRAEFAAEFPKHRQMIGRVHDAREEAQRRKVAAKADEAVAECVRREEGQLAALRADLRGELREQLKDGLGVVCGTQDDWMRETVAEQLRPLTARLEAVEEAVRALQRSSEESAEMEAVVLARLETIAAATAEEFARPLPSEELGPRIDELGGQLQGQSQALAELQGQIGAAAGAADSLRSLRAAVGELGEFGAALREELSADRKKAEERQEATEDRVDAAMGRMEEALAARVGALDDLGAAHGAKLLRIAGSVEEWEGRAAAADEAARAACEEAVESALAAVDLASVDRTARAAGEAGCVPLGHRLDKLVARLDARPWSEALDVSDEVSELRLELASHRRKLERVSRLVAGGVERRGELVD